MASSSNDMVSARPTDDDTNGLLYAEPSFPLEDVPEDKEFTARFNALMAAKIAKRTQQNENVSSQSSVVSVNESNNNTSPTLNVIPLEEVIARAHESYDAFIAENPSFATDPMNNGVENDDMPPLETSSDGVNDVTSVYSGGAAERRRILMEFRKVFRRAQQLQKSIDAGENKDGVPSSAVVSNTGSKSVDPRLLPSMRIDLDDPSPVNKETTGEETPTKDDQTTVDDLSSFVVPNKLPVSPGNDRITARRLEQEPRQSFMASSSKSDDDNDMPLLVDSSVDTTANGDEKTNNNDAGEAIVHLQWIYNQVDDSRQKCLAKAIACRSNMFADLYKVVGNLVVHGFLRILCWLVSSSDSMHRFTVMPFFVLSFIDLCNAAWNCFSCLMATRGYHGLVAIQAHLWGLRRRGTKMWPHELEKYIDAREKCMRWVLY